MIKILFFSLAQSIRLDRYLYKTEKITPISKSQKKIPRTKGKSISVVSPVIQFNYIDPKFLIVLHKECHPRVSFKASYYQIKSNYLIKALFVNYVRVSCFNKPHLRATATKIMKVSLSYISKTTWKNIGMKKTWCYVYVTVKFRC